MRNYNQLTQTERYQIYSLRKANKNPTEISRVLGRHKYHLSGIEAQSWETRFVAKHINLLLNDT